MIALVLSVASAVAAPVPMNKVDQELEKKVAPARDKAIKYLKSQQKDGTWETPTLNLAGMAGGQTALTTLALLEARVPATDPALAPAVAYLAKLKHERTYVVSLQVQVLARAGAKKYAKEVQAGADWLLKSAIRKNGKLIGWSYPGNHIADNSNTHFAVMGLHAAAQAGAKVDGAAWKDIRALYADGQRTNGGWTYVSTGTDQPTRNMTVAGLLGLAVAAKHDKESKGAEAAFQKGMKALLADELEVNGKSIAYGWFTTAELGRALGADEFKAGRLTRAWYREGVEQVLKTQHENGSFMHTENAPGIDKGYPVISTACGLYLLGPPRR